jgi:YHS domain-containing protein
MKIYISLIIFIVFVGITTAQEPVKKNTSQKDKTVLEKDGKDPVCGMKVKKGTSIISIYKEKQHGFCSKTCKERFDKDPEKYIKK